MKIFKFGGSSIHNADHIKNVKNIISAHTDDSLIVVVSAISKTTNMLEKLLECYTEHKGDIPKYLNAVKMVHLKLMNELFENNAQHPVFEEVNQRFEQLLFELTEVKPQNYEKDYDRIVSFGELISSTIIGHYLQKEGVLVTMVDIREVLKTDTTYRNANVDYAESGKNAKKVFKNADSENVVFLTQGFIASVKDTGETTTLGREGSDFTAAVLAYLIDAESVTVWKDVNGIYSADPKQFDDFVPIPHLSYHEMIELSYFGARVLHPKTIKPLQNKAIPLYVKSFYEIEEKGTLINGEKPDFIPPVKIIKNGQTLITLSPKDFSFILEKHLSYIFSLLDKYHIQVNLFQHSAISFSIVIDGKNRFFENLIADLGGLFNVLYNSDLQLLTVRHYIDDELDKLLNKRKVYVEQRTRKTARFVIG
jgi:aspartate kinase